MPIQLRSLLTKKLSPFSLALAVLLMGTAIVLCLGLFAMNDGQSGSPNPLDDAGAKRFSREFQPMVVIPSVQPAIIDPPMISVALARQKRLINPDELVLAVTVNGKSCAYPIPMLQGPSREIFNVRLGDRAIAATW